MANAGAAPRVASRELMVADMNSYRGGGRYMLHREETYYKIGIIMNLVG